MSDYSDPDQVHQTNQQLSESATKTRYAFDTWVLTLHLPQRFLLPSANDPSEHRPPGFGPRVWRASEPSCIHGYNTGFPVPLALSSSFDPALIKQIARRSAIEARQDGVNWVYSPMVDLSRDARWGRVVEGAGEDPYLGRAIAGAWVRGYQQDDLAKPLSVAACVKHFAAYGAAIAGRDYNAVDLPEITLRQDYLEPYHAGVEGGAACIMAAFTSLRAMVCGLRL